MSDHSPLNCTIADSEITMQNKQNDIPAPKPNCIIATEHEKNKFFNEIYVQLNKVTLPDVVPNCEGIHCNHAQHRYESDVNMLEIIHQMEQAALKKLPIPCNKTSNNIKKGHYKMERGYRTVQFWNSVWNSAGKPHNTELQNIMKRTRNIYHFHIRKNKRILDGIKNVGRDKECWTG